MNAHATLLSFIVIHSALVSLDGFFEYSDPQLHNPPLLKENLIKRGMNEPAIGMFFMLGK